MNLTLKSTAQKIPCLKQDSNSHLWILRPPLYLWAIEIEICTEFFYISEYDVNRENLLPNAVDSIAQYVHHGGLDALRCQFESSQTHQTFSCTMQRQLLILYIYLWEWFWSRIETQLRDGSFPHKTYVKTREKELHHTISPIIHFIIWTLIFYMQILIHDLIIYIATL